MRPRLRFLWVSVVVLAVFGAAIPTHSWGDSTPVYVWVKLGGDGGALVVSRSPGGEALSGKWTGGSQCSQGGIDIVQLDHRNRSWVEKMLQQLASRRDQFLDRAYYSTSISAVRDSDRWQMFSRPTRFPGEGFTDAERALVGRWRHTSGGRTIDLELRDDRTGEGSDGSSWTWMAAEGGLDLMEQRRDASGDVWYATGWILRANHESYRSDRDPDVSGTRLTAPEGPR